MSGTLFRDDEVDILCAERGAGLDLRLGIAWQIAEFARINFQLQLRKVRAGRIDIGFNVVYFTDLDAAQLDFRVVFHDQTGPIGNHRERADRDDHQNEYRCPPDWINSPAPPGLLAHPVTPTSGSCRTARIPTA